MKANPFENILERLRSQTITNEDFSDFTLKDTHEFLTYIRKNATFEENIVLIQMISK